MEPEGFYKRRFTNTGHPGDANTNAIAAVWQHLFENTLGLLTMRIELALNQGDGLGQGAAITVEKCL